ncbi:unnamed protein product [Orchesella dallaii]|uniref:Uncharacterized protein n=1 Tax=Orchesella dallaii TaxID=48710 RepID=A0ABP1Q315_9HEXA
MCNKMNVVNVTFTNSDPSISCYECVAFSGWTWKNPPLPIEESCEEKPLNIRLCRPREICHLGKMKDGNRTRIQRSVFLKTCRVDNLAALKRIAVTFPVSGAIVKRICACHIVFCE